MRITPVRAGLLLGYALPWLVLAPAALAGTLNRVIAAGNVQHLMPVLALLALPGALAGVLAAVGYPDRRSTWRFTGGLFLGASLAAAPLLWLGSGHWDFGEASTPVILLRRLAATAFGGPFLAGFWVWVGSLLGAAVAYGRRERRLDDAARPDV